MNHSNNTGLRRSPLTAALMVALLAPMAGTAMAQDATDDADTDKTAATIDRVNVVGSRIKRADVEGPAPVTVIGREQIDREGFQTVGDMLQSINQGSSGSFTGDLAVTGFTPNAQVVNLRNLGPGYTLTLINGRRPAQYPQPYNRDNNVVNIRAIPSSIVDRVEILTGGASAIYGSDAVAGVVNIVLRENFDGQQIRGTVGTTAEGGGDSVKVEFTGGHTSDRWNTVYALQYGENESVFASQRDFLADTRNGPLGPRFTNPALSLAVLRINPNQTLGTSIYYPGQAVCDQFGYTTVTTGTRGTYCGGFTQSASRSITNADRYYSGYTHNTFDFTDNLQGFAAANFYKSDAKSSGGTEFWSTSSSPFNRTPPTALAPFGNQLPGYYDPSFNSLTFLQRVFNPFELGGNEAATTLYDELTYDVSAGLRGTFADRFDWEASLAYSKYDYEADRPRLLAKAVSDYFLGAQQGWYTQPGTGTQFPIYTLNRARWNTPITPEIYRSLSTRAVNTAEATSSTFNFNVSGDLFELPAGAVGFAGVVEAGRQTTDLRSDPRTSLTRPYDDQTIYNLTSSGRTEGERDRYAAGVEFRVPIFSMLTANLAARYDKYDDITQVDDAITTMAGLEFRPFESFLLRASYATSFRAPDMQMVYAEGSGSFQAVLDQYACRAGVGPGEANGPRNLGQCNVGGDPTVYTIQTAITGNPLLEEEKGKSFGYGFVWDIVDNMSFSVDYYRIKLEDQALNLSAATLLANEANCRLGTYPDGRPYENASGSAYCQNVYALVQRAGGTTSGPIQRINSAFINAALVDTSGLDVAYKYRIDTDRMGTFILDTAYSIVLTDKYKQFESDPLVDYRDIPSLYNSRSRARGSLRWDIGDWSTTVFGTRYGSVRNAAGINFTSTAGEYQGLRLKPYMLYNLSVSRRFSDSVSATLQVANVLNNHYRYDASQGYPFFSAFNGSDPEGRRFYLSLAYKF